MRRADLLDLRLLADQEIGGGKGCKVWFPSFVQREGASRLETIELSLLVVNVCSLQKKGYFARNLIETSLYEGFL